MTKASFNTRNEAAATMGKAFASGKITAWNDKRVFGKVYVRVQIGGNWFDLTAHDLASWVL